MGYGRESYGGNNSYQPYSRGGSSSRGGRGGYSGGGGRNNDINHVYEQNPSFKNLTPFKKDFYVEHPDVSLMTQQEVKAFRDENQMTLDGQNIPRPMATFAQANWPKGIADLFEKNGFTKPTPIQGQGWPMALSGRNLIGIAQTGSGKTLSFILPAFVHILAQPPIKPGDGPACLVLAPTRELACQIHQVVKEFGTYN
jgi:ATP-dependent RNA helicase DDX5/DBP2